MTYQQFIEFISNELTLFLEGETIAEAHTSLKNNGVTRLGVTISDPTINISPTIYLEEFYKQYQNGAHLLDIIKNILDTTATSRSRLSSESRHTQSFRASPPIWTSQESTRRNGR